MTYVNGDLRISGTRTSGPSSPGVVVGPVTYALDTNNKKVPVEYRRARASRASARSAGLVATTCSLVSAVCAVLSVRLPSSLLDVVRVAADSNAPHDLGVLLVRVTVTVGVLAVGIVVSSAAWRVFRRRRLRLPTIAVRPFRSLIPVDQHSGRFVRAVPVARCTECAEDNRFEQARVRRGRRRRGQGAYTRCRLGHTIRFRENSLFSGRAVREE